MNREELKMILKAKGISYWEIADRLGCSEQTFLRWLRHDPSVERAERIMSAIADIENCRGEYGTE